MRGVPPQAGSSSHLPVRDRFRRITRRQLCHVSSARTGCSSWLRCRSTCRKRPRSSALMPDRRARPSTCSCSAFARISCDARRSFHWALIQIPPSRWLRTPCAPSPAKARLRVAKPRGFRPRPRHAPPTGDRSQRLPGASALRNEWQTLFQFEYEPHGCVSYARRNAHALQNPVSRRRSLRETGLRGLNFENKPTSCGRAYSRFGSASGRCIAPSHARQSTS